MNNRKIILEVLVLLTAMGASFEAQTAQTQTDYDGWTGRLWAGVVCRCVEDDNVTFQDPTFGTAQLEVDGNSTGIGFDVERRLSKLIGLDLAVGYTDLDIDFKHSVSTGVQQDSLAALNIWFAVNFHVYKTEKFDFWVGPQIAYVAWLNDLSFDVPAPVRSISKQTTNFPHWGLCWVLIGGSKRIGA